MALLKDTTVLGSLQVTDNVIIDGNDVVTTSKTAVSAGLDLSLVTTGEKYTWNNMISGITMNGASMGTSGVVDLGTIITEHQDIKQDGITGATVNRFGVCSTNADVAAKTVTITTGTFSLEAGAMVIVKFANANTANNPTLNVNSTGAKNIFIFGSKITTSASRTMLSGAIIFIYDGTQYNIIGNFIPSYWVPNTRTVNGKALSADITLTASDVGALANTNSYVPTSRTVNSKALSSNITLTASDVGALPDTTSYVPPTRTINSKALSSNITLTAADVGALADTTSYVPPTRTINSKALSSNITLTASDVGALPDTTSYVPPTRTINNKALSANITLTAADVGALATHQDIKQDGITGATIKRFGTCSTKASTAAKAVSIGNGTFSLEAGVIVAVKFSNANTASSPTLNVNSTGAVDIYVNNTQITTGGNKALLAGTVIFIYDGTRWNLIGNYYDTDTTNFVPTTRTVNGKALSADISLTAADVGALSDSTSYVPTTRTINSKALSANISLTASDVGAAASSHTHTKSDITDFPSITDNTSSTALASTNSNLITARSLYYHNQNKKISIGSASAGTAISADDITAWDAGSVTSVSVTNTVLTITEGTAPSLSYTAKTIPNISVTSKNVVSV